jgi:rhamnogalacturonyl hydrolase YesR
MNNEMITKLIRTYFLLARVTGNKSYLETARYWQKQIVVIPRELEEML